MLTWLALAAALLLMPVPAPAVARARALAGRDEPAPAIRSGRLSEQSCYAIVTVGGGVLVLVAALRFGAGLGVAAAVAFVTGLRVARTAITGRRTQRWHQQQLAAVRQLRAELEAGARPEAALGAIPIAPARSSPSRAPGLTVGAIPTAPAVGHAFRIAQAAGVPLTDALAGVVGDLEARADLRRAVSSAVAGARSSAALLAGLPLLGLLLGAAMGAHPLAVLTGSGAGRLVCCIGVLLDAAGVLWTQRLVARAEWAC